MLPEMMEIDQAGSIVTVALHRREVTHAEMQTVVDECNDRMRYSKASNFVFDFQGVEFLASACLGVLIGFLQDVEHCRGRIAIAGCSDNVAFLFKTTRLDTVFPLFDDTKQAAESF